MPPLFAPILPSSHSHPRPNSTMKPKKFLLDRLPGIRWAPHDIPSTESSSSKPKSRNPFALKPSAPQHGAVRLRKSTLSLTSEPDVEVDARTHAQGQSIFFARLPIELRRMVYEYVMGAEIVHLTLSTKKKRFGHFLCNSDGDSREYMCRVLVFGKKGARLYSGGVTIARVCRRMYVLPPSSDYHYDSTGETDKVLGLGTPRLFHIFIARIPSLSFTSRICSTFPLPFHSHVSIRFARYICAGPFARSHICVAALPIASHTAKTRPTGRRVGE